MPPKWMVAPLTKLVPVIVSVKELSPAILDEGDSALMLGVGLLTTRVSAADSPPPTPGLKTVTESAPAVAMSDALIGVVNSVALTNVVDRSAPSMRITEASTPSTKSAPLTCRVKPEPPAVALDGERLEIVGAASPRDVKSSPGLK